MTSEKARDRRWWVKLAAIAAAGVVLRVVYVMVVSRHVTLGSDATWYLLVGGSLHDGLGFVDPETLFATGEAVPTANFPPLYPSFLALVQTVGGSSETIAQLAGAVLGSSVVVVTALLARRLTDGFIALVAAVLVAISPMLIAADGSLMSEALYVPLVTLAVLFALDAGRHGRWWAWALLGVTIGLAVLTRAEALTLLLVLVLPVMWWSRIGLRARITGVTASVLVVVIVVTPWVLRNASVMDTATIATASPAMTLAGANCDATYAGESLGSWEFECTLPEDRTRLGEVAWSGELRSEALSHVRHNLSRLPLVLVARELRVWGLWDPSDLVRRDAEETRTAWFQWVVRVTGLITLVGGAVGLWMLRDRGREVAVLLGPVLMVALSAFITHGNPRFRTVAEPELLIGLAVTGAALFEGVRTRRQRNLEDGAAALDESEELRESSGTGGTQPTSG